MSREPQPASEGQRAWGAQGSLASLQLEQVPVPVQVRQVVHIPGPGRGGATSSGVIRSVSSSIWARSIVALVVQPA
jgi:hypothetical protein